jgi:hypothetical protein
VVTADPALGRWLQMQGLCAIPEDIAPPAEVAPFMERPVLAGAHA